MQNNITTGQFFSLLYISIMSSAFMFVSTTVIDLGKTDAILFPLLFAVFYLIAFIPIFIFYKRSGGKGLFEFLNSKNRPLSIFVSVLYLSLVFIMLLRTVARFDLFVSSEIFPQNTMTLLIVLIIIVSTALSFLDIGALSRAATVFLLLVIPSVSIIVASAFNNINEINFTPFFMDGFSSFFKQGFSFSMFFPDLALLILFLGNIKGNIKKSFLIFDLALLFSLTIITFTVVGALGEFSNTELFPAFAISSVGEFSILERFETLQSSVWTLCVVSKITLQIIVLSNLLKNIFPKGSKSVFNCLVGLATIIVIVYISNGVTRFSFMSSQLNVTVTCILLTLFLPTVAMLSTLKGAKNEEKNI